MFHIIVNEFTQFCHTFDEAEIGLHIGLTAETPVVLDPTRSHFLFNLFRFFFNFQEKLGNNVCNNCLVLLMTANAL